MNCDDYDKTIIEYIKNSLEFDKNKSNDIYNVMTTLLQNLMILSQLPQFQSDNNIKLSNLLTQLHTINKNELAKQTQNVLIFFYINNCKPSSDFVLEWKNIKEKTNGKYTMVAINCENKKYSNFCAKMNVVMYPTLKYIVDNVVYDYFDEMQADKIIQTFKL